MSNASAYQRYYWFPKVAEDQHGEYCRGCGISKDSNWKGHKFTGLRLDKINNDGNHTICDNSSKDFQLLCISCNRIKNPNIPLEENREMTESEKTNRRAEKPLMDWLYEKLDSGETVTWKFFVSEGSFKFDISPETIERRYYKKYFIAPSAPFELSFDQGINETIVILKNKDNPKVNLDIDTHPDTLSLPVKHS